MGDFGNTGICSEAQNWSHASEERCVCDTGSRGDFQHGVLEIGFKYLAGGTGWTLAQLSHPLAG